MWLSRKNSQVEECLTNDFFSNFRISVLKAQDIDVLIAWIDFFSFVLLVSCITLLVLKQLFVFWHNFFVSFFNSSLVLGIYLYYFFLVVASDQSSLIFHLLLKCFTFKLWLLLLKMSSKSFKINTGPSGKRCVVLLFKCQKILKIFFIMKYVY